MLLKFILRVHIHLSVKWRSDWTSGQTCPKTWTAARAAQSLKYGKGEGYRVRVVRTNVFEYLSQSSLSREALIGIFKGGSAVFNKTYLTLFYTETITTSLTRQGGRLLSGWLTTKRFSHFYTKTTLRRRPCKAEHPQENLHHVFVEEFNTLFYRTEFICIFYP